MDQIVAAVQACGVDLSKILVPGISPGRLRQVLAKAGYPYFVPNEVEELLQWANGTVGGQELVPLVDFPGAAGMIEDYRGCLKVATDEATPDYPAARLYDDRWMPVFLDGCGGFYVTRGEKNQKEKSPIAYFIDWLPTVEYGNLRELLEYNLECAQSGAFYLEDGLLMEDLDRCHEIGQKYGRPVDLSFWYRER